MSFVVEDGSGLASANAFISIAYMKAYFFDRGRSEIQDMDANLLKSAIVRATDDINMRFCRDFQGELATTTQALLFPRDNVVDRFGNYYLSTILPVELQKATAELARYALTNELDGVKVAGSISGVSVSESGGGITVSESYSGNGLNPDQKEFPLIESLLKPILENNATYLVR
jgi:hypothetical protein